MKKNSSENPERTKKIKKQLVSTGVYIALAAAVVGITSNSVKKILNGADGYEIPQVDTTQKELDIPHITESGRLPTDLPPQTEYQYPDKPASDTPDGISAEVTEGGIPSENELTSGEPEEPVTEPDTVPAPTFEGGELPTVRVRPVMGYISREFSTDELIYTPTMNDFRTHDGVDITGDIGTPVLAFADGIVSDVYNDPFMGMTVVLKHSGGLVTCYSNLSAELPKDITVGTVVSVGSTVGGIGETAIVESAEVPHVHFEMYLDEQCINPEEYLPNS